MISWAKKNSLKQLLWAADYISTEQFKCCWKAWWYRTLLWHCRAEGSCLPASLAIFKILCLLAQVGAGACFGLCARKDISACKRQLIIIFAVMKHFCIPVNDSMWLLVVLNESVHLTALSHAYHASCHAVGWWRRLRGHNRPFGPPLMSWGCHQVASVLDRVWLPHFLF